MRLCDIYDWDKEGNAHSYFAVWHRSRAARQFIYWTYQQKLKLVARFLLKHSMWWNDADAKRWKGILES